MVALVLVVLMSMFVLCVFIMISVMYCRIMALIRLLTRQMA